MEVSLIDGNVEITPKEDGQIDPAHLLKATYDSGVTAAQMDVIARGKIVKDPTGDLTLQVEPHHSFTLSPNDLSKQLEALAGTQAIVTVRGQLFKKPAGKKETGPFGPPEAANSRNTTERIDAKRSSTISDPCGHGTCWMQAAAGEYFCAQGTGHCARRDRLAAA